MSAGFSVAGEVFWGTNGAVEIYLETLAAQAAVRVGPDDPLTAFFREEREGFFMGKVVFLDEWLTDEVRREQFLEILDAATAQILREGGFSGYGREWAASLAKGLRSRLVGNRNVR
jgi:hypothetical protein